MLKKRVTEIAVEYLRCQIQALKLFGSDTKFIHRAITTLKAGDSKLAIEIFNAELESSLRHAAEPLRYPIDLPKGRLYAVQARERADQEVTYLSLLIAALKNFYET